MIQQYKALSIRCTIVGKYDLTIQTIYVKDDPFNIREMEIAALFGSRK